MILPYTIGDAIETAVVFLITVAGCIALLLRRPQTRKLDYKYFYRPLVVAAFLLVVGGVGVCLVGQRWELHYIFAYLTLHRIEHANVFRNLAFVAYALLFFGVATFMLIRLNEKRKSRN